MLVVETVGRIRREHFAKGKTIKEIARADRYMDARGAVMWQSVMKLLDQSGQRQIA
jgi:hypothetical protein